MRPNLSELILLAGALLFATSQQPASGFYYYAPGDDGKLPAPLEPSEPAKSAGQPEAAVGAGWPAAKPTVEVSPAPADEPASSRQSPEAGPPAREEPSTTTAPPTTTTSSAEAAATSAPAPAGDSAASWREEVRETELEAVAAVDASIGFGGDLFGAGSALGECYDEYGNARFCEPPFENIAFERPVKVSSECGQPASRFCIEHSDQMRHCHMCMAGNAKKRHPAGYLTDLNNPNEPTCWVSAPISAPQEPGAANRSASGSESAAAAGARDNVTLELSFQKQYEIVYISLQFCSLKPDSLAIHKSMDFGKSWTPYQFYSSDCAAFYGLLPASGDHAAAAAQASGAQCHNSSQLAASSARRIAFSPLEGRGELSQALERAGQLQDWITATDVRITLDKHQASWIQSSVGAHSRRAPDGPLSEPTGAAGSAQPVAEQLINPSDTFNYAIADLTVGGRCKCNGHASRCVHAKDGQLECDCRHNTAGRECEKCAHFHFDRPWAPASQFEANPCQPCNCNGHSRKCHFDAELYRLSGRRSGGVCMGCRDNTDGRYCHYCKEGFMRDHSKPMSHQEACKHCNCHPIGSLSKVCNQTTGQCPCKEGVVGLQCSRCAFGYQQSRSLTEPCIKLLDQENEINYYPPAPDAGPSVDGFSGSLSPASAQAAAAADGLDERGPQLAPPAGVGRSFQRTKPGHSRAPPPPPAADFSESAPPDHAPAYLGEDEEVPASPVKPRPRNRYKSHWSAAPGKGRFRSRPSSAPAGYLALDDEPGELDDQNYPLIYHYPSSQQAAGGYPQQGGASGSSSSSSSSSSSNNNNNNNNNKRYDLEPDEESQERFRPAPSGRRLGAGRPGAGYRLPASSLLGYESAAPEDEPALGFADGFNRIQGARAGGWPARGHLDFPQPLDGSLEEQPARAPLADACNNCARKTRRINSRKFCQLDYAIRAKILSWQVGEDWSKLSVEIVDIFKSPAVALASAKSAQEPRSYQDNSVLNQALADEPATPARNDSYYSLAGDGSAQASGFSAAGGTEPPERPHRLKVATLQTIWIPSEDFQCRCPSLMQGLNYLLLGSLDNRDGVYSLLLDRHGVAMRWNNNIHQSSLMKYQRKQSRGKCGPRAQAAAAA